MRPHRAIVLGAGLAAALTACDAVDSRPWTVAPPVAVDRASPRQVVPEGSPNLLLVTIDTLRADYVGTYGAGEGRTPTLDALAARGVVFERAYSPSPLTLPAHATLLTGRYPPAHGVRHNALYRLDAGLGTLAGRLQGAGWSTAAVVGAVVLGKGFGLEQGFDHYDAEFGARKAMVGGFLERRASEVTDAALQWLATASRPFFLWVHYYDPHSAYDAPPDWAQRFPDDPYAAEIAYADAELGRLLEALGASADLERTLVVTVADHGESLGEHGEPTHAYTLYDATQRVPWILAGPGIPQGKRLEPVVSLADVAPTVLGRVGIGNLEEIDGLDLTALIGSPAAPIDRHGVYLETLAPQLEHGFAPLYGARSERWLAVRAPHPELYDNRSDPRQVDNIMDPAEPPAPFEKLASIIDHALSNNRSVETQAIDDETLDHLAALGYAIPASIPAENGIDPKEGLEYALRYEVARQLYLSGRVTESERIATALQPQLPGSTNLDDLLLRISLTLNDSVRAAEHAERILGRDPDSVRYLILFGYAKLGARDLPGAVAAFERATALQPTNAEALVGLMWRGPLENDLGVTQRAAERAIAAAPEDPMIAALVGDNWDRLGAAERALAAYRRAVEIDPSHAQARIGIAVSYARMGNLEEARQHFAEAGAAAQGVVARMRIAMALERGGNQDRAAHVLRGILSQQPGFEPARRELARIETGAAGPPRP